jgi:hypothetical protein
MPGILNFQQFVGGPDSVVCEQTFPSTQKTVVVNFQRDINSWTFASDHQTLVVDTVKFNRSTGQPNFGESTVIGSFPKAEITGTFAPSIINATSGTVSVHFPADMYTGPIIPDARANVPVTVLSLTWTDNSTTPPQVNSTRFALVQCYEPDVVIGDPTTATNYTALSVGE